MGFYAPGTLVEDARRHGVEVRPVDVTRSGWDATLEPREAPAPSVTRGAANGARLRGAATRTSIPPAPAVRLGLRSVRGLGATARDRLERALAERPFTSIDDVVRRSGLDQRGLRHLAEAGAFDALLPHEPDVRKRRAALWTLLDAARGDAGPLAPRRRVAEREHVAPLPAMTRVELTEADYRMTGISLAGHPMVHVRPVLEPNGVRSARGPAAPRARRRARRHGGAGDLPPASGHGEGIRVPHARGRDGTDQRRGHAASASSARRC